MNGPRKSLHDRIAEEEKRQEELRARDCGSEGAGQAARSQARCPAQDHPGRGCAGPCQTEWPVPRGTPKGGAGSHHPAPRSWRFCRSSLRRAASAPTPPGRPSSPRKSRPRAPLRHKALRRSRVPPRAERASLVPRGSASGGSLAVRSSGAFTESVMYASDKEAHGDARAQRIFG